jgi:hypothetical protein
MASRLLGILSWDEKEFDSSSSLISGRIITFKQSGFLHVDGRLERWIGFSDMLDLGSDIIGRYS